MSKAEKTVAGKLIAGLLVLGYEELKPTTHYRVFAKPQATTRLYVGKSGALRLSRTGLVRDTISVSDLSKAKIMLAGQPKTPYGEENI